MNRTAMGIGVTAGLVLAHLLGVVVFLGSPDGLRITHDLAGWAASIAGVVGTAAAARIFARGDHLRRVWMLLAAGSSLLLVGHALRSYWVWTHHEPLQHFAYSPMIWPRMLVVGAANVTATWGLIQLASTYTRSGLEMPRSPRFSALWIVLSAAALFLLVWQFRFDIGRFGSAGETAAALTNMVSTLGDTATVVLITPILRIAYLMRGGRLARVWWAVGLSGAMWLLYDYKDWIAPASTQALELLRILRTPGLALMGLAGLLQQDVVVRSGRP